MKAHAFVILHRNDTRGHSLRVTVASGLLGGQFLQTGLRVFPLGIQTGDFNSLSEHTLIIITRVQVGFMAKLDIGV
jgi:hypothetical protein